MNDLVIQDSVDYARHDYGRFLAEYGLTAEQVRAISENDADMIDRIERNVQLCSSPIDGRGIFARQNFAAGEPVAMARDGNRRTFVGRYTNHSPHPNAEPGFGADSNVYFFALRDIRSGDEVTIDYRQAASMNGRNMRPIKAEIESTARQKVERVQSELSSLPQLEIPLRHYFIDGVLAREMTVPKDGIWIGKIHKFDQINMLLKGDMSVLIDGKMVRVQPPFTYVASKGTKRAGWAHEESVWTCIVATDGNLSDLSLDEIDRIFVAESDAEYREGVKCLG